MTGFLTGWISAVISFGVQLCVRDFDPAICADVILMKSDLWHPGLWSIYQNPSLSLDVLLDSNLIYNDHIATTVSVSMSRLGQLNQGPGCSEFCMPHYFSNKRKYDHVTPILKDLRWLPVRQQLCYRNAIMAFKCMTGCAPDPQCSRFIQRSSIAKRTTRNSQMLQIPLCRTATGQRLFDYRTVKHWNSLDPALKLKPTLRNFLLVNS